MKASELLAPSQYHEEARQSIVYRLSELMFGSLLAAYVLGFVGFASAFVGHVSTSVEAAAASPSPISPLLDLLNPETLNFLLISVAFSYLTASLYISYNVSILTMPHLPLYRLSWDFLIALLQAILFGFAMLYPVLLPVTLSSLLLVARVRQVLENYALRRWCYQYAGGPGESAGREDSQPFKDFTLLYNELLTEPLSSWRAGYRTMLAAVGLFALGALLSLFDFFLWLPPKLSQTLHLFINAGAAVSVVIAATAIFQRSASFISHGGAPPKMDMAFSAFREGLMQLASKRRGLVND